MLLAETLIVIVITVLIFLSNLFSIAILLVLASDPYKQSQGLDYCVFSLALSDLIYAVFIAPLSIITFVSEKWVFGDTVCKMLGYISYTLWAVDVNSLFWLSVDRYLYITDSKYSTYKMRTKARCICKIILSWVVSALYSFAPIIVNQDGRFLKFASVCTTNWFIIEPYYLTVTCIIIFPCFLATIYNFCKIFLMRFIYQTHRNKRKLTEAYIQYLMDPNHKMSLALVLVFWISWFPYTIHILQTKFIEPELLPTFFDIWSGHSQGIWKLPILIACCPRYRDYLKQLFGLAVTEDITPVHRFSYGPVQPVSYSFNLNLLNDEDRLHDGVQMHI